ncbi:hypothetical protein WFZ85_14840 [Flavobacterium sp. j3]|uniref:Uncharacterized protein n=1 Tax=Flavobacterium aureirubrum TaxID=3133147 RepID=A0ABU9N891_9FLAO
MSISQNFKDIILDSNFIKNNPEFYQNYPSLFSNAFSINEDYLDFLDISGYLYYQSTIYTDSLIDEKDISKFLLITICQEESIKILSKFYGLEDNFWKLWNQRRNEYFQAVYIEKELYKKEVVTIEEFEILADQKSAFGKVAIDCLYSLDKKSKNLYQKLLLSHKYFSVAFQLNDDIQDFKNDFQKGQFNWAIYLLKQENLESQNPDVLQKYLYIRGVSKKIYMLAIDYCDKSLDVIKDIDVPSWKKVIADTKKALISSILEIDNYIELLTSEIILSNKPLLQNNLDKSLSKAIEYIKTKQQDNGSWREYVNQGGISNIWGTAFITSKLSESQILKSSCKEEISKALSFLSLNTTKSLWG